MKKLLFATGDGIGNIVQTIPVIRTLSKYYDVDFWMAYGSYPIKKKLISYVKNWYFGKNIYKINMKQYYGVVTTHWAYYAIQSNPIFFPKILNSLVPMSYSRSEVDCYMQIARDMKIKEKNLEWHGACNYTKTKKQYDIVIHNGYNKTNSKWKIKEYPYYKDVVNMLKDYKICSVGAHNEYIKGTYDETGHPLLNTLGLIKNAKLFLGNDSGLYHCASALETKNIVIFTATSTIKNYDKRFHKHSTIINRSDLKCLPCQGTPNWLGCKNKECQNIYPEVVVNKIKEIL